MEVKHCVNLGILFSTQPCKDLFPSLIGVFICPFKLLALSRTEVRKGNTMNIIMIMLQGHGGLMISIYYVIQS